MAETNNKKPAQKKSSSTTVQKQVKKVAKKATKKALKNRGVQIALIVLVVLLVVSIVVVYLVKPEIFDSIFNAGKSDVNHQQSGDVALDDNGNQNTDNGGNGNTDNGGSGNNNNGTGHVIDGASVVMTAIDVGQGDGLYLEFPSGENMFVDGGTENGKGDYFSNIQEVFTANSVTTLDYYFVSHTDYDHIKYIPQVCGAVEVKRFLIPYISEEISLSDDSSVQRSATWTKAYKAMKAETYTENGESKSASITYNLGTFDLGGDSWVMHCYTYDQADYPVQKKGVTAENANCISPVCFLQYAGRTLCLTGDVNYKGEQYLYNKGYFNSYDIDILKVAHHGSTTSTHQTYFLDVVDPEYAIISVGADNSYNHPTDVLLQRLSDYVDVTPDDDANGIQKVYRTDLDGNVTTTISSDGKISITTQKNADKNVVAVACVMYQEDNNIEIVYVAYTKKEGEE